MKNLLYIILSKIVVLIVGIIAGFVIPWLLSVEEYGYYQVFILYFGYLGLFHFGFNDGIYLTYGGHNLQDIPKEKFRRYFKYLFSKQVILMTVGILLSLFLFKNERKFIFLMLSISILFVNLNSYFHFISQSTKRFKLYSYMIILQKILTLIPILLCLVFGAFYQTLIIGNLLVNISITLIYIFKYKNLVFGKNTKGEKGEFKNIYTVGTPLLIGNFIGTLIFTVDKMIIDIFYEIEYLAYYAFAVQMLAVILVFYDSIYQIMYPTIKRLRSSEYNEIYFNLSNIIMWLSFLGLFSYFVFSMIIKKFMPDYIVSLEIFAILVIGVLLRGENIIVKKPFILAEKKQNINLLINISILGLSIILNIIAFIIFNNLISIAIASLISFSVWYIVLDILFAKMKYTIRKIKYFYLVVTILVFLLIIFKEINIGFSLIILIITVGMVFIIEHRQIIKTYKYIKNFKRK